MLYTCLQALHEGQHREARACDYLPRHFEQRQQGIH